MPKRLLLTALNILVILLAHSRLVLAVEAALPPIQLQITPTQNHLEVKPGGHYEGQLTVINSGAEKFDYAVYARPYLVSDEDYDPIFNQETSQTMLSTWVTIASPSGTLLPLEQRLITYAIDVPQDVPDNSQTAVIFVETGALPSTDSNAIVSRQRLGLLLFASVEGHTRLEGRVVEWQAPTFLWRAPVKVSSLIENTGNTHFVTNYSLSVTPFGSSESIFAMDKPKQFTILPGTRRLVPLDWEENVAEAGVFEVEQTVAYLDEVETHRHWVIILPPVIVFCMAVFLGIGLTIYLMWLWRRK